MIARLRDRDAFDRLRREGTRVRSGRLWCSFVVDPTLEHCHVGFAIGRNVGTAVTRNRLRRRMRSALSSMNWPTGLFLVGAAPGAGELKFDDVTSHLDRLTSQMKQRSST